MSQHDLDIANQTFPNTRSDLNLALKALGSNQSGSSAPSTTYANGLFYNTTSNLLQIRNEDNDAYITLAELDQSNDTVEYFKSDSVRTALIEFTDGDDALAIADGGALTVSTSLDMNGTELILDADADTSIHASTDDIIDIKVGNTDVAHIVNTGVSQGALLNRNPTPIVINGDMKISQRGDMTGITSGQYITTDRFFINMINLGTWSFAKSTDTPTGLGFASSLKIDCTTADASPASADNFYLSMQSEGQNLQIMEKGTSDARTSTIAYWIKSNKTGNYVVELWDRTNDRHVGKVVTISSANTWEKHVCNFPADTSGALANTNARSIMISWAFDSGSNFTSGTLPTSWASRVDANRFVGTNLGLGDNTANEVLLTGVQWEMGTFTSATMPPFQHEDAGTSLARCQRYCSLVKADASTTRFAIGFNNSTSQAEGVVYLPVSMRTGPTLVTSGTAGDYGLTVAGAIGTCSSVPIVGNQSNTNPYFQDVFFTQTSLTSNNPVGLCGKTTDGFLRFESEL